VDRRFAWDWDYRRRPASKTLSVDVSGSQRKYEFASTHINLPIGPAAHILQAGHDLIPDEDLAGKGGETHPHITLKYGVDDDRDALRNVLAGLQPFDAT
jgi:hypothetical protein